MTKTAVASKERKKTNDILADPNSFTKLSVSPTEKAGKTDDSRQIFIDK